MHLVVLLLRVLAAHAKGVKPPERSITAHGRMARYRSKPVSVFGLDSAPAGARHGAMIRLVLYQPDIPQNLGACLRLSACMGCAVHVIEPCGFPLDDAKLKRAAMDYFHLATLVRHRSWDAFMQYRAENPGRLLLLETDGDARYSDWRFAPTDYILLGRESAGTPRELYPLMDATLSIPMREGVRSLNVAMAAGMLAAEAARQSDWSFV